MMHINRFLILSALVFPGFSLFAETAHQGVVGGPFHGYAQDDSGQVQVQVGPIADFAVPAGLAARSLQNRIPSGDSSALEATLVLDDGYLHHARPFCGGVDLQRAEPKSAQW